MSKSVEMIVHEEIMRERLIDKQVEVLKNIEKKLDSIHHARKNMNPMALNFNTDSEAAELYARLLDLQHVCVDINTFRGLPCKELEELDVMFR